MFYSRVLEEKKTLVEKISIPDVAPWFNISLQGTREYSFL